ncbi:MAG: hypothetical protein IIC66_06840 [candidate division Zixibacteria bacterium]|nr:hypothetical protein [candidate division Zixibacteria bacterium]
MLFSKKTIQNRLLPFCGLLALFAITTSCGNSTGSIETNILFQEDFSGTSLATAWTTSNTGATAIIDASVGQPAPSLSIKADSGVIGLSTVTLSQPYSNAGGMSFIIQVSVSNPGRAGTNSDGIRVMIYDQGRGTTYAGITIRRSGLDSNNVDISYDVYPGGFPYQVVTETNIAPSSGFYVFKFTIYPDLTAEWFLDGTQKLATLTGVQLLDADLQLILDVRGLDAAAHFDNAVISR